jgi:ribosomal protein S18 acetylase RimI-like enzyme
VKEDNWVITQLTVLAFVDAGPPLPGRPVALTLPAGPEGSEPPMRIVRLIEQSHWQRLLPEIEAIFFAASATQSFPDSAAREAFAERWLGRYLARWPECVLIARAGDGRIAGYLAGCLENPATGGRFEDIAYFKTFASLCGRYPAHLHINLAEAYRSLGIGAALIEAFAADATRAGVPGMHIVTGAAARNVRFYRRCGFLELATARQEAGDVVFMGRRLQGAVL